MRSTSIDENRFFPNVSPSGFVRGKREKRWTLQKLKNFKVKVLKFL